MLQNSFAQGKKNTREYGTDRFQELNALLERNQKVFGSDVVALAATDTVVFKKEMGELDSKTAVPLAGSSAFLTVALIMELVDEGKLSLDDKVSQFIPVYSTYGKNYITLRHCLTNYTGIQSDQKFFEKKKFESLEAEVESFAKKEIQTNPGTEFRYSQMGISIAGRIAEIVMKKKFDQLIKQKILNPLGMSKTTFSTLDGSAVDPAWGARSSALDYLRFLQMLLNKGQYNGKQVLSENAILEMRKISAATATIKSAPKTVTGLDYALGTWVLEANGNAANVLIAPSYTGSWIQIDWCRNYAFVLLTKNESGDQKLQPYLDMKASIDDRIRTKCR
ncbi:MAG TPA: serine hydrolase [Flavisolibacter sp.]|jgi:CubicO group peptidase (beta-lactamase class C family)|nr:serine hydrolase [Flavisolibacter sp.]